MIGTQNSPQGEHKYLTFEATSQFYANIHRDWSFHIRNEKLFTSGQLLLYFFDVVVSYPDITFQMQNELSRKQNASGSAQVAFISTESSSRKQRVQNVLLVTTGKSIIIMSKSITKYTMILQTQLTSSMIQRMRKI